MFGLPVTEEPYGSSFFGAAGVLVLLGLLLELELAIVRGGGAGRSAMSSSITRTRGLLRLDELLRGLELLVVRGFGVLVTLGV
jgi:hypothetical protein